MCDKIELKKRIDNWFELRKDNMIEDLRKLIAIKSVKSQEEKGAPYGIRSREVLSLATSMLEEHGFNVTTFKDMIITAELGPKPPKMGILAHLDVVAGGDGWDTDPFEMVIKDGNIYGRGATDNKGPAVAALYAMYCARDLCSEFKNGFQILLGSGEESGSEDITAYLEKNTAPPNVFTPDADFPIVNAEKGRLAPFFSAAWEKDQIAPRIISLTGGKTMNVIPNRAEAIVEGFTAQELKPYCLDYSAKTGVAISATAQGEQLIISAVGKAGHAALPELSNNAQTALIEMLAAIPFADSKGFGYIKALNRLFPHGDYLGKAFGIAMKDDKIGELTLSFNVVRMTEYEISGNFDSRTPTCADDIDLEGMVRTALECEGFNVTNCTIIKSHFTDENTGFIQTLLSIYEDYTGNPPECLSMGGQTYVHGIPGGVAFGSVMPDVENNVHGPNEFISIDSLVMCGKMFAMAILEICG